MIIEYCVGYYVKKLCTLLVVQHSRTNVLKGGRLLESVHLSFGNRVIN